MDYLTSARSLRKENCRPHYFLLIINYNNEVEIDYNNNQNNNNK